MTAFGIKKPSLIVFDLDLTLWSFRLDKHTKSPFKRNELGHIVDAKRRRVACFPGIPEMLADLKGKGMKLAIASSIEDVAGAYQLLIFFNLNSFFDYKEIYPGAKTAHFQQLKRKTGLEFSEMIFFDDMKTNIRDVEKLGVASFLVPEGGVNYDFVKKSVALFQERQNKP